ncbi:nucleoside transporter C-terminal domain-containing protein [Arenimonas sp. GDDSR-1]|uniref:NupC/NupG family nucleoside CNT transporter n=1 Tax=Arenimonas sp. GDDSR-1 TaxID=2950125 RepID=UPI0026072BB6|nr:nucleoside transporter C-terminal domain-containing protein [Arenimonas sp. GDDSR-1]
MSAVLFGLFGLSCLLAIAWLFSNNKRAIDWRLVLTGVALQIAFAAFVLLTTWGSTIFEGLGHLFVTLINFTNEGSKMILGGMADQDKYGFVFIFHALPTVIFFAAFMAILYHIGVMQWIVKIMALAITKVMRVSGAETTSVCASVFIGQTEAPLTVRPYINRMTDSELLTMMIGGMAHIAGGVMAIYIGMLAGTDPAMQQMYAKHFLAASIMAAPATLLIAKMLIPETGEPLTRGKVSVHVEKESANVIDAAAGGASDGMKLAINIAAMLLAFVALIAMINSVIGWVGDWHIAGYQSLNMMLNQGAAPGAAPVTLNLGLILGYILAPIAWVIGVDWNDAVIAGGLIGQKVVLNEFIAYLQLSQTPVGDGPGAISEHSRLILTYALCGFANFASIAIQIGGIGSLAPERRADLARFGLRAVLGGSIATLMTATIAGVLLQLGG